MGKQLTSSDVLEWIKIAIAIIIGYIIIKALIRGSVGYNNVKCLCDCVKEGVIYLK